MQLPEPFSFIFTWFAALPLIFWIGQALTNAIIKDFLILKVQVGTPFTSELRKIEPIPVLIQSDILMNL